MRVEYRGVLGNLYYFKKVPTKTQYSELNKLTFAITVVNH